MGSVSIERRSAGSDRATLAEFSTALGQKAKAQGADAVLNARLINTSAPTSTVTGSPSDASPSESQSAPKYVAMGTMVRYLDASCSS